MQDLMWKTKQNKIWLLFSDFLSWSEKNDTLTSSSGLTNVWNGSCSLIQVCVPKKCSDIRKEGELGKKKVKWINKAISSTTDMLLIYDYDKLVEKAKAKKYLQVLPTAILIASVFDKSYHWLPHLPQWIKSSK